MFRSKHKATVRFLFVFLATTLCLAADAIASDPGPSELVLRLDTGKQTFVQYEPVVVTYTLANPTESVITSHLFRMGYFYRDMKIWIQYEDGEPVQFNTAGISDVRRVNPVTIHKPGQVMTGVVSILHNYISKSDVLAFPKLGRYTITGRLYVGEFPDTRATGTARQSVYVKADPVEIEVVEPSAVDRQVIEFLGSDDALVALLRGRVSTYCQDQAPSACFEELRSVTRRFSGSAYSPDIAYYLAINVGMDHGLDVSPGPSVAADLFLEFLKRWPNHARAQYVLARLPYTLNKAGRKKEAAEWIDRYAMQYPGNRLSVQQMRWNILGIPMKEAR